MANEDQEDPNADFYSEGLSEDELKQLREAEEAGEAAEVADAGEVDPAPEAGEPEVDPEPEPKAKPDDGAEPEPEVQKSSDDLFAEFESKHKGKSQEELLKLAFQQNQARAAKAGESKEARQAAKAAREAAEQSQKSLSDLADKINQARTAATQKADEEAAALKKQLEEDPDGATAVVIDKLAQSQKDQVSLAASQEMMKAHQAQLYQNIPDYERRQPVIDQTVTSTYGFQPDEWGGIYDHRVREMAHDATIALGYISQGLMDGDGNLNKDALRAWLAKSDAAVPNGQDPAPAPQQDPAAIAAANAQKIEAAQSAMAAAPKSMTGIKGEQPKSAAAYGKNKIDELLELPEDDPRFAQAMEDPEILEIIKGL